MIEEDVILETRNITKKFPGVIAVNGVNFKVYKGKVNALVGENGAGKSTLMKILAGVYTDFEGNLMLNGKEVRFKNTRDAQEKGIAMIYQELNLLPNLSVMENIFIGREFLDKFQMVDYKKMYEESVKILQKLDLDINPKRIVSELSVGQQQMVEVAKALSLNARVIIMDEPTSAISEHEIETLFKVINSLKKQGVAIVYISHKLDEVFEISDMITVMRDGKVVGSGPKEDFDYNKIVRMMVGRNIKDFFVKSQAEISEEFFKVENICLKSKDDPNKYIVNNVSFTLRKGEILGIFGLMGAGRSELLEAIFGVHPKLSSGRVFLEGKELEINSPEDAIKAGIGFVPEDRKQAGLILSMAVSQNITLTNLKNVEKLIFISEKKENDLVEYYINRLNIKTSSPQQIVENLSGGNQQKVVIAKWLAVKPKVLFMDEPTRGIDVNAKSEIYKLISELAKNGLGIIMVSSELPEILAMSDRIIVLSEGRKTGEFKVSEANEEILLKAAIPRSMKIRETNNTIKTS